MKLALIYSGGTIGCAGVPLMPLPANEFQTLWGRHVAPRLGRDVALDWHWLEPALDSCEMTPANWIDLARMAIFSDGRQATLLLHGTDTMAWTAAALAFLLTLYDRDGSAVARLRQPVVLTGAQRPLFTSDGILPGTDALANLDGAIEVCGENIPGVTVAFGGTVLPGARVMKMSTSDDRAFECPKGAAPCPVLPPATAMEVLAQLDRLAPQFGAKALVSVTPLPSASDVVYGQIASLINGLGEKLGAIHLNGFGIGNFPSRSVLSPLLRAAHDRGILIVAGSQVPHGDVDPSTYGAGHWLGELGAISTADMATPAVHAKLYLALALGAMNGWSQAEMERHFLTPVAGELRG
ncbi:MAG TPA: asparaginase domain-containing protein [Thermohalobaculum sp.]|nr:asparaginase domain-containing protein [Thermohalobaculum sp.]